MVKQESVTLALSLIREVLWDAPASDAVPIDKEANWSEVMELLAGHGLAAVVLDVVARKSEAEKPDRSLYFKLIGMTAQAEARYEKQATVIRQLGAALAAEGKALMVIKGHALARYYPHPERRVSADIDIWCYGHYKRMNEWATAHGLSVHYESAKHSLFFPEGMMVENHQHFFDMGIHSVNDILDRHLRQLTLSAQDPLWADAPGVYVPPPQFHAMFLMRHMSNHLLGGGLHLKQMTDWCLLLTKEAPRLDLEAIKLIYEDLGLLTMAQIITYLCVRYLGLPESAAKPLLPPTPPVSADVVWHQIIAPTYPRLKTHLPLFKRMVYKGKRFFHQQRFYHLIHNESFLHAIRQRLHHAFRQPKALFKNR